MPAKAGDEDRIAAFGVVFSVSGDAVKKNVFCLDIGTDGAKLHLKLRFQQAISERRL
jgi:hypothetical protein